MGKKLPYVKTIHTLANMRKILTLLVLFTVTANLPAQSKKKIKEADIQVKITWRIDYVGGKEVKYKEKEEYFNPNGKICEVKDYDASGVIKSDVKYIYSSDGQIIKEISLDKNGNVEQTIEYSYSGKLKTEKKITNSEGKVISKKVYEYRKR